MTTDRLPYDAQLTDDDPILAIFISRYWVEFLLGMCLPLIQENMWLPESDQDQATFQSLDALVRLMGMPVEDAFPYPGNIWLPFRGLSWVDVNDWTTTLTTLQEFGVFYTQNGPANGQELITFTVPWYAGSFYIELLALKSSNAGKFRWVIDGVDVEDEDIDLYNLTPVYNYLHGIGVTIDAAGEHTFMLKNVGKHASSSNYYLPITAVALKRAI